MFAKLTPNKVVNFGDENVLHDVFLWLPVVCWPSFACAGRQDQHQIRAVTSFALACLS